MLRQIWSLAQRVGSRAIYRVSRTIYFWRVRDREQKFKPVILITGCSSGLGLALAQLLYFKNRYRVVITARAQSVETLRKQFVENERFMIRQLDVTSHIERTVLVNEIDKKWGGINVLINNAGISYRSVVEHMTDADERKQLETNYLAPMALIRLVIPKMRGRGRGKIINISSVSGMLAMPTMASYSASKYALEGASEALWYEVKPFGIDVVLVQPGFINSKSHEKVYYTEKSAPLRSMKSSYKEYYSNMTPFVEKLMKLSPATPEKIALLIYGIVKKSNPPLWVPATPDAFIFYYLRRLLPRRLLLPFLYYCLPQARHWAKSYTNKRAV